MATNVAFAPRAQFDPSKKRRNSMIGKVKVAVKQLGIVEDDYKQMLLTQTGKLSLTECSDAQIGRVLDHLKAKGFKPLPPKGPKIATHPVARMARALWVSLYHLGAVHNRSEEALEAFAKDRLKCERLAWADQRQGYLLIEALKGWAKRAGWQLHCPATGKMYGPIERKASLCMAILAKLKAAKIVPDDWLLHDAAWKLCGIENAKAAPWTATDYEDLAAALGQYLRDAGATEPLNIRHFQEDRIDG